METELGQDLSLALCSPSACPSDFAAWLLKTNAMCFSADQRAVLYLQGAAGRCDVPGQEETGVRLC